MYNIFIQIGFLSFAKNMSTNFGKNISKSLSSKYTPKFFDHAKKSATYALKTVSKRSIRKSAEATSDLTGNTIADKTIKVSRTLAQNSSETVK